MRIDVNLIGGAVLKAEGVDDFSLTYTRPVKHNSEALEELLPADWWYTPLLAWPEPRFPWTQGFAIRPTDPGKPGWSRVGERIDD